MTPLFRVVQIALLLFSFLKGNAQVFLTLEGHGARRVMEYSVGDEIHYKLEGDKHWNNAYIVGLHGETGTIFLQNGSIAIDDITGLKRSGGKKAAKTISSALVGFGAQWLVYAALASLGEYEFATRDLHISGAAMGAGGLMKLLTGSRKYRVGNKKRLRIRDLRWQLEGA